MSYFVPMSCAYVVSSLPLASSASEGSHWRWRFALWGWGKQRAWRFHLFKITRGVHRGLPYFLNWPRGYHNSRRLEVSWWMMDILLIKSGKLSQDELGIWPRDLSLWQSISHIKPPSRANPRKINLPRNRRRAPSDSVRSLSRLMQMFQALPTCRPATLDEVTDASSGRIDRYIETTRLDSPIISREKWTANWESGSKI
jgi:hypothetical protein